MKKILVAVMVFGMAALAYAQGGDWHGGIRDRVQTDKQSIERGIERGTITRPEARKLNEELDRILAEIDRAKRDGRLNEGERERINRDLDRLESDIRREKRDGDMRGEVDRGAGPRGIRERAQTSKERIDRGIERKTISRREARRLNEELDRILADIERHEKEREKINRDLDKLETDIRRERQDSDGR